MFIVFNALNVPNEFSLTMKHFTRFAQAFLVHVRLNTLDVTRNSRLRCNGNNIFHANILLNEKTQLISI